MTLTLDPADIAPGLGDPVIDAGLIFRGVLDAMSHPGKVVTLPVVPQGVPAPLNAATAAIALSLADFETPLWVDAETAASSAAMNFLRFHCGCPITPEPGRAATAIVADTHALPPLERFDIGTDERPETSTTVIVQVEALFIDQGAKLTGPGIEGCVRLAMEEEPEGFWEMIAANGTLFPRGVDLILTAGSAVACLPRTVQVRE